ncbi:hypothetical protein ABKN59_007234 [Abortiporus biennis]
MLVLPFVYAAISALLPLLFIFTQTDLQWSLKHLSVGSSFFPRFFLPSNPPLLTLPPGSQEILEEIFQEELPDLTQGWSQVLLLGFQENMVWNYESLFNTLGPLWDVFTPTVDPSTAILQVYVPIIAASLVFLLGLSFAYRSILRQRPSGPVNPLSLGNLILSDSGLELDDTAPVRLVLSDSVETFASEHDTTFVESSTSSPNIVSEKIPPEGEFAVSFKFNDPESVMDLVAKDIGIPSADSERSVDDFPSSVSWPVGLGVSNHLSNLERLDAVQLPPRVSSEYIQGQLSVSVEVQTDDVSGSSDAASNLGDTTNLISAGQSVELVSDLMCSASNYMSFPSSPIPPPSPAASQKVDACLKTSGPPAVDKLATPESDMVKIEPTCTSFAHDQGSLVSSQKMPSPSTPFFSPIPTPVLADIVKDNTFTFSTKTTPLEANFIQLCAIALSTTNPVSVVENDPVPACECPASEVTVPSPSLIVNVSAVRISPSHPDNGLVEGLSLQQEESNDDSLKKPASGIVLTFEDTCEHQGPMPGLRETLVQGVDNSVLNLLSNSKASSVACISDTAVEIRQYNSSTSESDFRDWDILSQSEVLSSSISAEQSISNESSNHEQASGQSSFLQLNSSQEDSTLLDADPAKHGLLPAIKLVEHKLNGPCSSHPTDLVRLDIDEIALGGKELETISVTPKSLTDEQDLTCASSTNAISVKSDVADCGHSSPVMVTLNDSTDDSEIEEVTQLHTHNDSLEPTCDPSVVSPEGISDFRCVDSVIQQGVVLDLGSAVSDVPLTEASTDLDNLTLDDKHSTDSGGSAPPEIHLSEAASKLLLALSTPLMSPRDSEFDALSDLQKTCHDEEMAMVPGALPVAKALVSATQDASDLDVTLQADFPLIKRDPDIVRLVGEPLDDRDWTYVTIGLNEDDKFIYAPTITPKTETPSLAKDIPSSCSDSSGDMASFNSLLNLTRFTLPDKPMVVYASCSGSKSDCELLRYRNVEKGEFGPRPRLAEYHLPEDLRSVTLRLGLILHEKNFRIFEPVAELTLEMAVLNERRALTLATIPKSKNRLLLPRYAYGLTREEFLGSFTSSSDPLDTETYAEVARKNVPVCTAVTKYAPALDPVSEPKQPDIIWHVNRNRGGAEKSALLVNEMNEKRPKAESADFKGRPRSRSHSFTLADGLNTTPSASSPSGPASRQARRVHSMDDIRDEDTANSVRPTTPFFNDASRRRHSAEFQRKPASSTNWRRPLSASVNETTNYNRDSHNQRSRRGRPSDGVSQAPFLPTIAGSPPHSPGKEELASPAYQSFQEVVEKARAVNQPGAYARIDDDNAEYAEEPKTGQENHAEFVNTSDVRGRSTSDRGQGRRSSSSSSRRTWIP